MDEIQSTEIYDRLLRYFASQRQLGRHGFPMPSASQGIACLGDSIEDAPFSRQKTCVRCQRAFTINETRTTRKQRSRCCFHASRAYGGTHRCCGKPTGSKGCRTRRHHVHTDNKRNPNGYITLKRRKWQSPNPNVYAIDCEMSYTVDGIELTRVTVVNHDCDIVYDTLVKPYSEVLDYNTEWSGIREKDMRHVTTTLDDVHRFFRRNFSSDTIFIGHSLESDFIALRLIHTRVVDTSLIFTHKRGLPHKRSLRSLTLDQLGLDIQDGEHDSSEDAAACMGIMMKKIRYNSTWAQKPGFIYVTGCLQVICVLCIYVYIVLYVYNFNWKVSYISKSIFWKMQSVK